MANLFLCHIFLVFADISHCESIRSLIFFCSYWWRVTETNQRSSHNPIAFVVWGDETLLWRRFVQTNSIVGNGIFLCDSTVHFECDGHHYYVWARFNAVQSIRNEELKSPYGVALLRNHHRSCLLNVVFIRLQYTQKIWMKNGYIFNLTQSQMQPNQKNWNHPINFWLYGWGDMIENQFIICMK